MTSGKYRYNYRQNYSSPRKLFPAIRQVNVAINQRTKHRDGAILEERLTEANWKKRWFRYET